MREELIFVIPAILKTPHPEIQTKIIRVCTFFVQRYISMNLKNVSRARKKLGCSMEYCTTLQIAADYFLDKFIFVIYFCFCKFLSSLLYQRVFLFFLIYISVWVLVKFVTATFATFNILKYILYFSNMFFYLKNLMYK